MKTRSTFWLCTFAFTFSFLMSVSSCKQVYLIEKETDNEYVLLNELPLNPFDRFILHWKTTYDSEFVKLDSRSGKFFYLKTYDYSKVLNGKADSLGNNASALHKELKWVKNLLWVLVGCFAALFLIVLWHKGNNDDENDSYPL